MSNFKVNIFEKRGIYSMQLTTGNAMVVLGLLYVVNNGTQKSLNVVVITVDVINFEQFFFVITLPKTELSSSDLACR